MRPVAKQAALDLLTREQHVRGSAVYHKWLVPAQLRAYGPAQKDIRQRTRSAKRYRRNGRPERLLHEAGLAIDEYSRHARRSPSGSARRFALRCQRHLESFLRILHVRSQRVRVAMRLREPDRPPRECGRRHVLFRTGLRRRDGGLFPLGNPNPILYQIAAAQFETPIGSSGCDSTLGNKISPVCAFNYVTAGDNSEPCAKGSMSCYTSALSKMGVGVLKATVDGKSEFAFPAQRGYSLATGLGTVNVKNLLYSYTSFVPYASAGARRERLDERGSGHKEGVRNDRCGRLLRTRMRRSRATD